MNILLVLIPVSLLLIGFAVWAFFWAVNHGQFDDLETPALRILEEDPPPLGSGAMPTPGDDDERASGDSRRDGHGAQRGD
jgi:cbb3-type cytochrome oxidase maturation protein